MLSHQLWSLDHEREWLASALSLMTTPAEKDRFIRNYLTTLTRRVVSFDGETDMDGSEYQEMETFCLRQLYDLEHTQ